MGQAANQYAAPVNVENLFSIDLWTGNAGTQTVTNGIDFTNKGGLLWFKQRTSGSNEHNWWLDTVRPAQHTLSSNLTSAQINQVGYAPTLSSTGYNIINWAYSNDNNEDYVGWSFRKQPKFFDMVTYKGNGSIQAIPHNLGSVPGMIITKRYDDTAGWGVYHRGFGATATGTLNGSNTWNTDTSFFGDTDPTSTHFTVGASAYTGQNNEDYIAYIFAHNDGDGGFGATNDQDIIKCDSYTGNASGTGPEINLGFEPQWLLVKNANNGSADWLLFDVMRGWGMGDADIILEPNTTNADAASQNWVDITPTGFKITNANGQINGSGQKHLYMAIRRGPMATPTDATKVFAIDGEVDTSPSPPTFNSGWPVDFWMGRRNTAGVDTWYLYDRLRKHDIAVSSNLTDAEFTAGGTYSRNDRTDGIGDFATVYYANSQAWMWRRAPGYLDVVAYSGTGSTTTISHNLGVVPEMMWIKKRSGSNNWKTFHSSLGATKSMELNTNVAAETNGSSLWNSTAPTASVFTLGSAGDVNSSSHTYMAYLFATLAGVSKVGSFTLGSSGSTNIDCGFSSGARFILAKKTSGTGGWLVWDTARGIVAGNDPYLLLNSNAAASGGYDFVDPYSQGFTIPEASYWGAGDYIFYAIA